MLHLLTDKKSFFLLPLLLLSACKVGEDYHKPNVSLPDKWLEGKQTQPLSATQSKWWKHFNDPLLETLLEKVAKNNVDVKIAGNRIEQARLIRTAAKADFLPVVNTEGSAIREANRIAFGNAPFDLSKPFNNFEAGFDASWELDVFGKKRRNVELAEALLGGAEAQRDQMIVSLLAETARVYVNIRLYQQQVQLTQESIDNQQNTARISKELFNVGKAPKLDVIRAEALVHQTQALLPTYLHLLARNNYALDILLGDNPGTNTALLAEKKPIILADKNIVLDAPATIIAHRPDIIAAEQNFAAKVAGSSVAKANLFPTLSIGGFFGLLSPETAGFADIAHKSWDVSGKITLPLLNYPRIAADIRLKKAEQEEALLNYRKTVQTALADIETALSSYYHQEENRDLLAKVVTENAHAVMIAREQYKAGITSFIEVLEAERTYFDAQKQYADACAATTQDFIAVYKQLGGSWN